MNGSELLLSNAERYGLMITKEVEAPRRLSRPNIGMSLYTAFKIARLINSYSIIMHSKCIVITVSRHMFMTFSLCKCSIKLYYIIS